MLGAVHSCGAGCLDAFICIVSSEADVDTHGVSIVTPYSRTVCAPESTAHRQGGVGPKPVSFIYHLTSHLICLSRALCVLYWHMYMVHGGGVKSNTAEHHRRQITPMIDEIFGDSSGA